ncbi:MAG: nucleotidyltransferase, partial [Zetaproteobacteria bacterium]
MHSALILAAGRGERMRDQGLPKPLVPFLGLPLLARSMRTLARAGIDRVVVAVGHEADRIAEAARRYGREAHLEVAIARAPEWERGNGASALAARELLQEPFLMVMCDHLFDPALLQRLIKAPMPQDGLVLAVDRRLNNPLVDKDDVTRVQLDGERITAIGKGLERFDGWDTGAFACTPGAFAALSASDGSVSDAVRLLAREGKARALDIGEAFWADLDDAAAMRRARRAMLHRAAGKAS